ncbi:MAG: hypothetical protein AB7F94_15195, partial [Nitrospira sp.]
MILRKHQDNRGRAVAEPKAQEPPKEPINDVSVQLWDEVQLVSRERPINSMNSVIDKKEVGHELRSI